MKQDQFISTVLSFSHAHHLWQRGSRILAAVSGGPDSLGLLLFLHEVAATEGITVGCCCVDHHLRSESGEEADYVEKVCASLFIPFTRKDIDVECTRRKQGGSVETVARQLRYQALRDVKKKGHYDLIATAHHGDDQAETVIFHFLRGAGTKGLSGIAPKRDDLIRPFLCVTKAEIQDFISHYPVTPCHDETNDIPYATRNKIRLELLPQLLSYNPRLVKDLGQTADILREEDAYLDGEAKRFLKGSREEGMTLSLSRADFQKLPLVLQRRALLLVMHRLHAQEGSFSGVERLRQLAENGEAGKRISTSGILMEVTKDTLLFYPGNTRNEKKRPLSEEMGLLFEKFNQNTLTDWTRTVIIGEKRTTRLDGWQLDAVVTAEPPQKFAKNQFLLDADKVGTLSLRYPQKGERFAPRGMEGTKEISSILAEAGVPAALRPWWPVACDEQHTYWVGLLRGSRFGLVEKGTRRFLVLTLRYTRRS